MTALAKDKAVTSRNGQSFTDPLRAAVKIYRGALTALDAAGNLVPAGNANAAVTRGVALDAGIDNTNGAAGDVSLKVDRGTFLFDNSAGADEITRAEIGDTVYVVDDQTVAKTDDSSSRIAAGICRDIAVNGVWVEI